MQLASTILIDGLIDASWIFIVAVGLTLIFGVLNILNIAHGNFYAIGAYVAANAVGIYYSGSNPPMLGLLAMTGAALAAAIVLGPLLERGLLRFFYHRDEIVLVLVTYALFLILEDATKLIWGVNPYYAYEPYSLFGNVNVGRMNYVGYDFFLIGLAVFIGIVLWLGLNRTRSGKVVLAVIHDREMSSAAGVNVTKIFVIAFTIGVFLAALAGAFTAPKISVQPGLAVMVVLLSFAVVVIGGLGSIEGAAIASLIVGLSRALAIHLAPWAELFIVYLVMAMMLAVRPQGIFAPTALRKI
ncbi:MAG: branched-chain amino acid ABC transporter permease [Xanthobacteraceae bacterium]|nr:branched-chain amino acid ABC transporter permease [Xanthobacteraceae bacterium]MBX3535410.1 branched-chain amino acid ABC transporter permease [Xanthobacteraceae bacterium]MBX3548888.1 branched-chain amino acid ABC transporter permease [Xanthobacteraceae bacterium]MCW5674519.1 branched-chain amino acid ABC transporter permease [Xanthobacteraceae bacterium]MCW5678837.1 branched-chain amino acid ABC transporter permease [Xanthobacteraceae bacterium]